MRELPATNLNEKYEHGVCSYAYSSVAVDLVSPEIPAGLRSKVFGDSPRVPRSSGSRAVIAADHEVVRSLQPIPCETRVRSIIDDKLE